MTKDMAVGDALSSAREALNRPVEASDIAAGWDQHRCSNWLDAVKSIEAYIDGDQSQRGFSIVRSLESQGFQILDNPRGKALLTLATALRQGGIDRYA